MKKTDDGYELSSGEVNSIIWLYVVLETQIKRNDEAIKAMARTAGVAREYGGAKYQLAKVLNDILSLVTKGQRDRVEDVLRTKSAQLVTKNQALHQMDFLRYLRDSDLDKLLDWAKDWFGCDVCMKDAKAAKKCELRRLLLGISPPVEHNDLSCEYGV